MKVDPKIVVTVLNWNGGRDVAECLESLHKVRYPNYSILVLDCGEKHGSPELLSKLGKEIKNLEVLTLEENLGYAGNNNVGIKHFLEEMNADYILLMNPDVVVDEEFLNHMIKAGKENPEVGILGPKIYRYDDPEVIDYAGEDVIMWQGRTKRHGVGKTDDDHYNEPRRIDKVEGSCMLIKRNCVEQVGFLDPEFFLYWEDTEYCLRASRRGYKSMFVPQAKVWHKVGRGPNSKYTYYMTKNRFLFLRKCASRFQRFAFLLYFLSIAFWYGIIVHATHYLLEPFLKGVRDGFRELVE